MNPEYDLLLRECGLNGDVLRRVKGVVNRIIKAERMFQRNKDKTNMEGLKRVHRREIDRMNNSGMSIEEVRREKQGQQWQESRYV